MLLREAAAERDQFLEHLAERLLRSAAEIRIEMNDGSSLLRPILNFSTSNDALRFTTVSKTTFRICESIRWPSASTTSLNVEGEAIS